MGWRRRRNVEQEVEREIRAHLELEAELAGGTDAARRKLGNMTQAIEDTGDAWLPSFLERLGHDLRFALRTMRKSPVYSVVAVLTLALGIGANTAIFSVVNGVLLKPLAYRDPDRLVTLLQRGRGPVSPADLLAYREQSRSFETLEGAVAWGGTLSGRDHPEHVVGLQVTDGTFRMLGAQALHGRTPAAREFRAGNDKVVVLSHGLWMRRFGGDPAIIGQPITLNNSPYTVVGVMPGGFQWVPFWFTRAEMWAPFTLDDKTDVRGQMVRVIGRLKPGVTIPAAQSEMDVICRRLEAAFPRSNAGFRVNVDPLAKVVAGNLSTTLLVLTAAVGFVLLIACANIANLALARAAERQKEIAVRRAMGAGWSRIFRQFLTESLLLASLGGVLGTLFAWWGVDALKSGVREASGQFSTRLPRLDEIGVDWTALAFTLLLSLLTGLLFGLAPALQATRAAVNENLKDGGRGGTEARSGIRIRNALIVAEVALSLILLAGAGLLLRSFLGLRALDAGFDAHNILSMTVSVTGQSGYTGGARESFYSRVLEDVQALPGVDSASLINHLPVGGDVWTFRVFAEGQPVPPPGQEARGAYRVSVPGYFRTMRIRLLEGRDFDEHDGTESQRVAVINEKLARRLWPTESALGKRITNNDPQEKQETRWLTVVGVVGAVKQGSWIQEASEEFYVPYRQEREAWDRSHNRGSYMTLLVRTKSDPLALAAPVRAAVWALNGNATIADVRSLEQVIATALWQERIQTLILSVFAAFAVLLAAIGIYGVMAYSVARRTQEIGIRMALGAGRTAVLWMVLRRSFVLVLAGIAGGLAVALALTRYLTTLLHGVTPADPITFTVIPALMAIVALIASILPARRATTVDPVTALRC